MDQLLEFAGNHMLLVSAAVFLTVLVIVTEIRHAGEANHGLSPAEAVRLINGGAVVLDLRGREDFEAGHIANARHVPLADLNDQAQKLSRFKGRAVIAYDDRGAAGGRAVTTLRKLAFEKAYSLRGGLAAWREEQLPLERAATGGGKGGGRKGTPRSEPPTGDDPPDAGTGKQDAAG